MKKPSPRLGLPPMAILPLEEFAGPFDSVPLNSTSVSCPWWVGPYIPQRKPIDPVELERATNRLFEKMLTKI